MNGSPESQKSTSAQNVTVLTGTGTAREITLTQGKVALVDAEDYEWLSKWTWCADIIGKKWYAVRSEQIDSRKNTIFMHREILDLRVVTKTINQYNRDLQKNNTSGYRGVSWDKAKKRWQAYIKRGWKRYSCGLHEDIISAAMAYDKAAIKLYGTDAILNFPGRSQ